MPAYTLPELSYDYAALEPHISGRLLELHHSKHHAAYVRKANEALEKLAAARDAADVGPLPGLERALAFNLSGHVLHSIFWQCLKPKGGGQPDGELAQRLDGDFGGFAQFKSQLTAVAASVMGSGWAALVWEPLGKRLLVTQIYDHQSNLSQGGIPIMVIDAWEHAYYLQYQNEKEKFFDAIWNVWSWEDIARRYARAKTADLGLKPVG